jgi:hypothetical protein
MPFTVVCTVEFDELAVVDELMLVDIESLIKIIASYFLFDTVLDPDPSPKTSVAF